MIEKILEWLIAKRKVDIKKLLHKVVWYRHEWKDTSAIVAVREVIKGDHRDFCLCWYPCARFHPDNMDNQCPRAYELYQFCKLNDMVTPVWECPDFVMSGD
jgi:hypothetical protein